MKKTKNINLITSVTKRYKTFCELKSNPYNENFQNNTKNTEINSQS